jgi:hypothetical protein
VSIFSKITHKIDSITLKVIAWKWGFISDGFRYFIYGLILSDKLASGCAFSSES